MNSTSARSPVGHGAIFVCQLGSTIWGVYRRMLLLVYYACGANPDLWRNLKKHS